MIFPTHAFQISFHTVEITQLILIKALHNFLGIKTFHFRM
jgi:hypothetical protein